MTAPPGLTPKRTGILGPDTTWHLAFGVLAVWVLSPALGELVAWALYATPPPSPPVTTTKQRSWSRATGRELDAIESKGDEVHSRHALEIWMPLLAGGGSIVITSAPAISSQAARGVQRVAGTLGGLVLAAPLLAPPPPARQHDPTD
ncbi:hypothetical protein GCM10027418_23400 [Mariniluteicoccus endophyticus]